MRVALPDGMHLRTPLTVYSTAFLASLGLAPLVACGGTTFDIGKHNPEDGGPTGGAGSAGTGGMSVTGGAGSGAGGAGSGGVYTGGAAGSIGTGGGETGGSTAVCRNPKPRLVDGQPTGFVDCEGGSSHRVAKLDCPTLLPRAAECKPLYTIPDGGYQGACKTDSDCAEHPNGMCTNGGQIATCYCQYGCVRDEDCGAGQICYCGNPIGFCAAATCVADGDCAPGSGCLSYVVTPGCGGTAFSCQTPQDNCVNDTDCATGQCSLVNGSHQCKPIGCAIGRPFLVATEARVAATAVRTDWAAPLAPSVDGLSVAARAILARRWTEVALMEHASIAAFARFALELLSLGAPPELVVLTHSAMADETRHARDAFALASAYAGSSVGPGRLVIDGALSDRRPLDVVRTAILEGCIGETVAAVEAAEALARASDPAVCAVLARVAEEEQRHAELAWRFVGWILDEATPELRSAARRELRNIVRTELESVRSRESDVARIDPGVVAHGILDEATRREIRRRVLSEVVSPCADAILAPRRLRRDANVVAGTGASIGTV